LAGAPPPDPAEGAHSAPQTSSWILGVLLLMGERRGRRGRGRAAGNEER